VVEQGTKITSYRNIWYIEFTKENVEKVLKKFNEKYRNTVLAICDAGAASYYGSNTYGCPNLIE
jgi:hypothetical protein